MTHIYIFFGELGSGKSYCGVRYAEKYGYEFFEGDSVVTSRMMEKVSKFKPIPRDIIEEYMEVLANTITDKAQNMTSNSLV
jgi:gluconate kinase